jgi:hypothetical protein
MRRISLFLLFLIPVVAMSQRQEKVARTREELAQAPVVKVEELMAHPDHYDKMFVRVSALWIDAYHGSVVCPSNDDTKCMEAQCPDADICKDLRKVLDKNLTGDIWNMRGRFLLVGRFGDTKTPPHMNRLRFVLEVFKIERVIKRSSH